MNREHLTQTAQDFVNNHIDTFKRTPLIELDECYTKLINIENLHEDSRFYFSEILRIVKDLHEKDCHS